MKTAGIESFYIIIEKIMGPTLAKQTTTDALYIVLSEMQQQGISITAHEISKRMQIYANDFMKAAEDVIA